MGDLNKRDISEIKSYKLEKKYLYTGKSLTKGTQIKYKKDNVYYKLDSCGKEGLVEYLVSGILRCSDLGEGAFVEYVMCKVNDKPACFSSNFLNDNEEFITMNSIYQIVTGKTDLSDYLGYLSDAPRRLDYLCDLADVFGVDRDQFYLYLNRFVQLDYLIENTDRHAHNYGVVLNNVTGKCDIAPIFDNARSLHTVQETYCSCTISGSFSDQLTAFSFPVIAAFKIDYEAAFRFLDQTLELYGNCQEIQFLKEQLRNNEKLFKM